MVDIAAGDDARPQEAARKHAGRRRAAGIYGAVITAAIIAAVGAKLATPAIVVAVVVTLIVYWLAEEYAEVLGEQAEGGRLPTRAYIRDALAASWPMVSASFVPLLMLVAVRLAGASAAAAANIALLAAVAALTVHGWLAGRSAQLRGRKLMMATSIAAALGVVMILLKDLVLINLH